ncbi:MAG TPA: PilZ domain-containing protein [Candidatus Acidoferrum sp.]|nr:PilZ domain-containing protein [Candidatus Acidoferrum sp.]
METLKRAVPHTDPKADWLPPSQRLKLERRRHPRALLSLPVRLRWLGPLGLESEFLETLDAGRGGLLVACHESREEGTLVWATFPFDSGASDAEPETSAHVARAKTTPSGGHLAGIEFSDPSKPEQRVGVPQLPANAATRNLHSGPDRRRESRNQLALLIRVRGADPSWPDDAMTMDISRRGLQFCTLRVYERGEIVTLTFPRGTWNSKGHRHARVARITSHPSDPRLRSIGVEFLS